LPALQRLRSVLSATALQVSSKPIQDLVILEDLYEPNILAGRKKRGIFGLKCYVR